MRMCVWQVCIELGRTYHKRKSFKQTEANFGGDHRTSLFPSCEIVLISYMKMDLEHSGQNHRYYYIYRYYLLLL
jgi:hypothetical protein